MCGLPHGQAAEKCWALKCVIGARYAEGRIQRREGVAEPGGLNAFRQNLDFPILTQNFIEFCHIVTRGPGIQKT